MKLKGINPIEQHVEKFVVGAVGLTLLGVVAMQFLSDTRITVGKGQSLPIDQAYAPAETEASRLLGQMSPADGNAPKPAEAPATGAFGDFAKKMNRVASDRDVLLPALGMATPIHTGEDLKGAGDLNVAAVRIPPTSRPTGASFRGTLDPMERLSSPDLAKYLPAEQPFDKAAVSVEAVFDGAAFATAVRSDPDGDSGPLQSLPPGWIRDGMEILAVQAEREELKPDGTWANAGILASLPGRLDLLSQVKERVKARADMPEMLAFAKSAQKQAVRPDYYRMIAGPDWVEPTVAIERAKRNFDPVLAQQGGDRLRELELQKANIDQQLASLPKEDRRPGANNPPTPTPTPSPDGGRGGRPGGAAPNTQPNQPQAREETPQVKRRRLETELQKVNAEIKRLSDQLAAMGATPAAPGATPDAPLAGTTPQQQELPLFENSHLRVWAHDIDAKPGAVYRYRLRVVTNNPLFGQESFLKEDQRSFAAAPFAEGEWSEWSDPVSVDRDEYFFITSASRDVLRAGPAAVSANAELYKYYYGYYRRASFRVEPGDTLTGEVTLPPKLWIFDLDKLKDGILPAPTDQPAPGAVPPAPGGRGRPGTDPGSGRGRPGTDPGVPPDPRNTTPGTATEQNDDVAMLKIAKPAPPKLAVSADAMLLDVATIALGTGGGLANSSAQSFHAIMRDQEGNLVLRVPKSDRATDVYKRLALSAEVGATQNQPKVPTKAAPGGPTGPDRRSDEPPRRGTPGGGGGGGG